MKTGLCIPIITLFATTLFLQSCVIDAKVVDSKQVTVTHEHRVELPANLYSPGSGNTPMFEKQGDMTLAVDMTKSGENTNGDTNPKGDPGNVNGGVTHQNITETKTFSINGGYALTDKIGLTGNVTFGNTREEYRPYIESWNLTQEIITYEYWAGIPLTWDTWLEDTWHSTENVQYIHDYQKVSKQLTRSYRYFDGELAIGKYTNKNHLKTGLYGGLGYAGNVTEGHMTRNDTPDAYARHEASFFKVFVLPSIAYRVSWLELGAALKGSFMQYHLKKTVSGDREYAADSKALFFAEPSLFLRFGPRAFRLNLEHKWLSGLSKSPFPTNKTFTSVGILTTLNVNHLKHIGQ